MADLDSQPKSIQSIYSWYSEGKLFVNRRYQRKLVWSQIEKKKLVESILKKFPVPAILLAERPGGTYEVIDGLQRLHTIVSFIENSFETLDEKFFDVSRFPTAKERADNACFTVAEGGDYLGASAVTAYLDYTLAITVMRGATESEIDDVFARINTYGHRLSDQERRQAGTQSKFSQLVREIACEIRGDASENTLELSSMPSISIDLPKVKHGYSITAENVFWVKQGILTSTDLRDSLDEQCLADISACILGGRIIARSKEALDGIYDADVHIKSYSDGHSRRVDDAKRIDDALTVYGADRFKAELKQCIDEIEKITQAGKSKRLRLLLFAGTNTNSFPAAFATLVIAFHEAIIQGRKKISDHELAQTSLSGLSKRIVTHRGATTPTERRKNIDSIKSLIAGCLVDNDPPENRGTHSTFDIDSAIVRSTPELPFYELKQGIIHMDGSGKINQEVFPAVINTICAIANNGKDREGKIIIGVADKASAAQRVRQLYGVEPIEVGKRFVVGINREAAALNENVDAYLARWKKEIKNSKLSQPLKDEVLSSIDFNEYYGLGVIVITVPRQKMISFVGEDAYWREGDSTEKAAGSVKVSELTMRFV
ncbi:DUF262 domain-containing protein [Micromonospora sp. NPDC049230]|uniref:GmrSD restriction endonuclease domain-containing protein n=1 Tax=Micromonospora sp. NPDC049230 TaxID=3155502 RepID=UPI0033C1E3EF